MFRSSHSVKNVAVYLGDNFFNSKGTNTDLVEARVKKGILWLSAATDVTMGTHAVETLLLFTKVCSYRWYYTIRKNGR